MTNEEWRSIKECPMYAVSNYGQVKNLKTNHILIGFLDKYGYKRVCLQKNGKQINRQIHRLVAQMFLENSKGLPCVNHKDENKTNNYVDNLEWCTHLYNNIYGSRLQSYSTAVWCVEMNKKFNSMRIAEKETGISHVDISRCCRGVSETAGGYRWEPYNNQDKENENDRTTESNDNTNS